MNSLPTSALAVEPQHEGTVPWLREFAPGGPEWTPEAVEAVTVFALVWNLFEGSRFGHAGHRGAVEELLDISRNAPVTADVPARDALRYWAERWAGEDVARVLNFRARREVDALPVVRRALSPEVDVMEPAEIRLAALVISWRLRNNLFHGWKRLDRLNTQVENLRAASRILAPYIGF